LGGFFRRKTSLSPEFAARFVHPVGSDAKRVNASMMLTVLAMEEDNVEK